MVAAEIEQISRRFCSQQAICSFS